MIEYFTSAVSTIAVKDFYQNNLALNLLTKLRNATDKKIYIGHNPMIANPKQVDPLVDEKAAAPYLKGLSHANEIYFTPLNCELIQQPLETISVSGRNTLLRFSEGSMRLDISKKQSKELHPENDFGHMNDDFGKLYLDHLFSKLM